MMRDIPLKLVSGQVEIFPAYGDFIRLRSSAVPVNFEGQDFNGNGINFSLKVGERYKAPNGFKNLNLLQSSGLDQSIVLGVGLGDEIDGGNDVNINGIVTVTVDSIKNNGVGVQSSPSAIDTLLTTFAGANANRKYALIQNNDTAAVLRLTLDGSNPTATKGFRVLAGQSIEFSSWQVTGAIKGILETAASGVNNIEFLEG